MAGNIACTCLACISPFPITLSTEPAVMARAHAFIYHFVTAMAGVQYLDSPNGTRGEQSVKKRVFF